MLAFAHKVKHTIEAGEYEGQADAARQLGLTRARVSQLLDLTLLSPKIQEKILFLERIDGIEPTSERKLRWMAKIDNWQDQLADFEIG
jgi:predicted XRE-type DNA-binding protein